MHTMHLTPSTFFKLSIISLCLILAACNQQETTQTSASAPVKLSLFLKILLQLKKELLILKLHLQELFVRFSKVPFRRK